MTRSVTLEMPKRPKAISAAKEQQLNPPDVEFEVSGKHWFDAAAAPAFSGDSPSIENEAITGAANVVPASTFFKKSRRPAPALPRISSGAIGPSVSCRCSARLRHQRSRADRASENVRQL